MIPVISRRNAKSKTGLVGSKYYWLYDKFTTDRAAGAVNGTLAEPYGGARTVVDTNSKISISSNLLDFATGAAGNSGLWWNTLTRQPGLAFLSVLTRPSTSTTITCGWDADKSGAITSSAVRLATTNLAITTGSTITVGTASNLSYAVCTILRGTGAWYFVKGGEYTNWTLVYIGVQGSTNLNPAINVGNTTSPATASIPRVPRQLYVPTPLQSDGFSTTTTDGLGNAEANGPTGTSYTAVGTWGVSDGALSCSALSGGVGFRYLNTSSADVIIDADLTRTAGVAGIVARYEDASNYLIAYHDGTNFKLDKVVAGTTTNLVSAAGAYGAGQTGRLVLEGTTARIFYNNAAIGAVATVPSSSITKHGLYTTDTGNSFDNFVVWAGGTGNEYSFLDTV